MSTSPFARSRRRIGYAVVLTPVLVITWYFFPGLPVLWGPHASASSIQAGRELFAHQWTPGDPLASGDGLGPVFNANSCAACHFQGGLGGAGPNRQNVLAFEAHPTTASPRVQGGLVHACAVDASLQETPDKLKTLFPIVPGGIRVVGGCQIRFEHFNPVRLEHVNSIALFGAGWIDRISGRAIQHHYRSRALANIAQEFQLDFNTVPAGRPRMLSGGRVGKFGWKAQFATLREFVAAACANEIGLGNPLMDQAKPLACAGYPDSEPDLTRRQFKSMVAFVDTLPRPTETIPDDPTERSRAAHGKELFSSIGCALCHTPDLGGIHGAYSDFLLHKIEDPRQRGYTSEIITEVKPPESHPRPEEWKTPALWGVADSAPYFHDGGSPTLRDAILRHAGDAATVTTAYRRLADDDQAALIAFLKSLKAPADAEPVETSPPPLELASR